MFKIFKRSNDQLRFTKVFLKKLKKKMPDLALVSLSELEVKTAYGDLELTHHLGNAYLEYKQDPKGHKEIIDNYLNSALELYNQTKTFESDQIVPIIKDKSWLIDIKEDQYSEKNKHVYEVYNESLIILYAQNSEHSIHHMTKFELIENNISMDGLKEKATANLLNILPEIQRKGDDGYYILIAGGDYEASLILDQKLWTSEFFPVNGNMVIGIPARDVLLITGSEDKDNLKRLSEAVKDVFSSGNYLISDKLFIYRSGKFEVYLDF